MKAKMAAAGAKPGGGKKKKGKKGKKKKWREKLIWIYNWGVVSIKNLNIVYI